MVTRKYCLAALPVLAQTAPITPERFNEDPRILFNIHGESDKHVLEQVVSFA